MKLRLFILRNAQTSKTNGDFYATKVEAKKVRDELNSSPPGGWVVSPGPDHHRYRG